MNPGPEWVRVLCLSRAGVGRQLCDALEAAAAGVLLQGGEGGAPCRGIGGARRDAAEQASHLGSQFFLGLRLS